jgi:hypothetical protein
MGNYAVFLEGNNFRLGEEDGQSLSGFFITKRVEASSGDEARRIAIQDLWRHSELVDQDRNIPAPSIEVKAVHELPGWIKMKDTEMTTFPMDDE